MRSRIARLYSRLTYANVTATLALFIALGGTSFAAITLPRNSVGAREIRAKAVRSAEIRNRSVQVNDISKNARAALRGKQGPAGPAGAPGVSEHARVGSTGRIVGGTAVASAWGADQPGLYRLTFARDVSNCAYSATLAAVPGGNVTEPAAGRITVASGGGAAVVVKTYDAGGTAAEQPFHIFVAC
jgi:hypothetical protein